MSGLTVHSVLLLFSLPARLMVEGAVWDLELCRTRESHWRIGQHGYVYSGQSELLRSEEKTTVLTGDKEANLTAVTRDWAGAGDWCQLRCMDLVSLETEEEWSQVRERMEEAEGEMSPQRRSGGLSPHQLSLRQRE